MNDWAHNAVELIGKAELKRLSARSDSAGLLHLAGHVVLLVVTGWLIYHSAGTLWVWPAMFLHGTALIFLFAPLHETIHRTAFHSRALNDVVAFVIGVLIVLPREWFRAFHFAHHRFTQERDDPELATSKPATTGQMVWHMAGLSYWVGNIRGILRRAAGRLDETFYATDRVKRSVILEARLVLAIYAACLAGSIAAGSTLLLWYWIIPALLGQPMLRLYLICCAPDKKGRGLGRLALDEVRRMLGPGPLHLTVVKQNERARGFYLHMGFTPTGEVETWRLPIA